MAMDKSYDLAIMYFKYNPSEEIILDEISIADDPDVRDYAVSQGSPNAQKNNITYGTVLSNPVLAPSEDGSSANVSFDIIIHNALIDHGSSGGPLLNASGKLVGLNFAGFESNHHGCAVPMSKINEFLNTYVYNK
jgi:S1-C subfamily serine protease